jgi:hypothetical protein
MPFQIQIDAPIIRITFSGNVTRAEFVDLLKELSRVESDFNRIPDRLTDMSGATEWESGFTTTSDVAAKRRAQTFPNKFKSAIVAPSPAAFGIARMFQTLNDHPQIEIQVFKAKAEAERWLGLNA